MWNFNAKVLNGLPVWVESEVSIDRDEPQNDGVIVDDMKIFWRKTNKNGERNRALVIEQKMTDDDWECLGYEVLDFACGRWIG